MMEPTTIHRKYYLAHREHYLELFKKRYRENKEFFQKYYQRPDICRKGAIRWKARYWLKKGLLTRRKCQWCGDERTEMHHPDYTKPLLVQWFCKSCHGTLHGGQE